jgi:hypothetical protein
MESKFYVSLEAARLLKEKGYNEVTKAAWCGIFGEMKIAPQIGGYRNSDYSDDIKLYSAPTKSEAIDWLESKGMRINIIYDWLECRWYFTIINGSPTVKSITELEVSDSGFYKTRLEAEEAAIIKALELL